MKAIEGHLPLNEQYRLESISRVDSEFATTCDNCEHVITNIAEVKDIRSGKSYFIGTECLETVLTYRQNSYFEYKEFMKQLNKQKKIASMIKNGSVISGENRFYIYKDKGVTEYKRNWNWSLSPERMEYYKKGIKITREMVFNNLA
jgi:hypothetical protein